MKYDVCIHHCPSYRKLLVTPLCCNLAMYKSSWKLPR